ncbi:AAA family ATPase [Nostoc sp.]|uniref:AAA family ATPase n=1 Tax=Nostoc sp. TaxID=1180 RepID=UPI002FF73BA2
MKVKRLKMQSFRGIGDLTLEFDVSEPIVFIGINGVGKSSILDALSLLLSRFMEWIGGVSPKDEVRAFSELDISNKDILTRLNITILLGGGEEYWEISRNRNGVAEDSMHERIRAASNAIWRHWQNEPQYNLPLAVYYPVNRAVLDISLEIPNKTQFKQIDAYEKALTGSRNDFAIFFQWFRNREDLESELLRDNRAYQDSQLEAVRQATSSLIPSFSKLRVRRSPLRMTVIKYDQELIINQLSDGEKCLLAIVEGVLPRILAILNI